MLQSPSGDLKVGIDVDATNIKEAAIELPGLRTKEKARILRKIDWHVLPLVSLLYLLSFLCVTVKFPSDFLFLVHQYVLPSETALILASTILHLECVHIAYDSS